MDLNENKIFVQKLVIRNEVIYIKLLWKPNEFDLFHVKAFIGDCTWTGKFSIHFAENFRGNGDETIKEYQGNVLEALIGDGVTYTHEFTLDSSDSDIAKLSWRKDVEIDGEHARLIHGVVPLHKDKTPEPMTSLLDILIDHNKELKKALDGYKIKYEAFNSEMERCKLELGKFVTLKSSLETTLYGRFVQLLNSKKRRIQLLEENLSKYDEIPPNNSELD